MYERSADSGGFQSKVYQDEPILITAAQLENYPPPKYREMRKIGGIEHELESKAKIFYKQAKFMEDFEDSFDYRGRFERYFPTYQDMDHSQLRGYFSWRTKVRRGIIEKTQLSFAFAYIYELLNQIGVSSTEEGFHQLKNFWAAYREFDTGLDRYVTLWLKDYVVYNNMSKSLLENCPDGGVDGRVLTLLNYEAHDADTMFSTLKSMSPYSLENSKLFKQYPDDVKNVVYDVFSKLADHLSKNGKNGRDSFCERFFGRLNASSYIMFKSAVFYHHADRNGFVYEINDIYRYECKNGNWSCVRLLPYKGQLRNVGALLKTIDSFMRPKYGFKSTLKAEETTEAIHNIITEAIDRCLENKRKAALPKIEIDVSKLQNIRNVALEIQNKLTVEEFFEEEANAPEIVEREGRAGLNDVEYRFMKCLLYGTAYDDLVKSEGLMLSMLIDAVNERFFDTFGDTVIIDDGGKPALIEDYVGELKGIIKE